MNKQIILLRTAKTMVPYVQVRP